MFEEMRDMVKWDELPTGKVIHDEIGVSWEIIASQVYFCSRNEVKKFADFLPRVFYTAKQNEAAQAVLETWDKAIKEYDCVVRVQSGRTSGVKEKWEKARPKYGNTLKLVAQSLRLSDDELDYIRMQPGKAEYCPGYDGEYDVLDIAYDEIANKNKAILLKEMEPKLKELSIEQAKELTALYNGYACLFSTPFVVYTSVMSADARQDLKRQIDGLTVNTQEQLRYAVFNATALVDCQKMLQKDRMKLRGGWDTVWASFEEHTKRARYLHVLRMAAMLLRFPIWELEGSELEMLMEFSFCLNDSRQAEILSMAKKKLVDGNIDSSHTLEEIQPFICKAMREEQEILEHYFELDSANSVYDIE